MAKKICWCTKDAVAHAVRGSAARGSAAVMDVQREDQAGARRGAGAQAADGEQRMSRPAVKDGPLSLSDKLERDSKDFGLGTVYCWQMDNRSLAATKREILNNLYAALDELCFINNAPKRRSDYKTRFKGELDNHNLNALMKHGSKSLAEEKKILRDINTQRRDVASFQSLEVLKKTIQSSYYNKHCQKLLREIEQFQTQRERADGSASVKEKIPNYESLEKAAKDQIKFFCDESLEYGSQGIAYRKSIRRSEKALQAKNKELHSLRTKLAESQQKRDEAYMTPFLNCKSCMMRRLQTITSIVHS